MRYKLTIEYDGTGYVGWQRQNNGTSIQQCVEEAILKFSRRHVNLYAAGRTDAGVHAFSQVAHFDLDTEISAYKIRSAVNHFLKPYTIRILEVEKVKSEFHSRFSAISRTYIYKIINTDVLSVFWDNRAWHMHKSLDVKAMQTAANYLIGHHDLSSFRASGCQARSPLKTIDSIEVIKVGDLIEIMIKAPSFLHNQVRIIVGSLVQVGQGANEPDYIRATLEAKDRSQAGQTAPACGLYLLDVRYPESFTDV